MISVLLILVMGFFGLTDFVTAQDLNWAGEQQPTRLKIICDTPDVPIFLDGQFIGRSPITELVQVSVGQHVVSCFPANTPQPEGNSLHDRYIRDLLQLGRQTIRVELGEILEVGLTYRDLGAAVHDLQEKSDSAPWIGGLMVIIVFVLIGWAVG